MKSKEELNALKEEVETLNKKLHELTDEELAQVNGGFGDKCNSLLVAIVAGEFLYAQELFRMFKSRLTQQEANIIRMAFLEGAGYSIDQEEIVTEP